MHDTHHEYLRLSSLYAPIALAVLVLVFGAVAIALVRFRARPGTPSLATDAPAESKRIEPAYVVLLMVIATVLLVATYRTEGREDALAARPALTVRVTAAQWDWAFAYAGTKVVQRTGTAQSELVLPAGRDVRFQGSSLDVIHDFWVPAARFQRQLFPGHTASFDIGFARPGVHMGECAMFCGLFHDRMTFTVRVLAPAAFDAWLARRAKEPA